MARERMADPRLMKRMPSRSGGFARPRRPDEGPRVKLISEEILMRGGDMPAIRERRGTRFIIYGKQLAQFISWQLIATLFLILMGAIGSLAIHAHVTNTALSIDQARIELVRLQGETFTYRSLLRDQYTIDQIERIAIERLGMAHPDPAQIIDIYVPLQRTIRLNMDDGALPAENFLWEEIRSFLTGVIDRIFGG